MISVA
jgi:hypothetical protein